MGYFSVKDFERHQHYKDRRPPWIKLYNDLLSDYEFCKLPDASKMHLVAIWLLASRYENRVPDDIEWLAGQISATEKIDLKVLVDAGFIIVAQACSKTLADCKQSAMPEKETETEGEGEVETEKNGRATRSPLPVNTQETRKRGTRIPDNFPGSEEISFALNEGWTWDRAEREAAKFRDHWVSVPGQKGVKLDWPATWRNWIRRDLDGRNKSKQSQSDKDDAAFREAARRIGASQ